MRHSWVLHGGVPSPVALSWWIVTLPDEDKICLLAGETLCMWSYEGDEQANSPVLVWLLGNPSCLYLQ